MVVAARMLIFGAASARVLFTSRIPHKLAQKGVRRKLALCMENRKRLRYKRNLNIAI